MAWRKLHGVTDEIIDVFKRLIAKPTSDLIMRYLQFDTTWLCGSVSVPHGLRDADALLLHSAASAACQDCATAPQGGKVKMHAQRSDAVTNWRYRAFWDSSQRFASFCCQAYCDRHWWAE